MPRPYVCTECNQTRSTSQTRGRLPKVCPECRGVTGYVLASERQEPADDPPALGTPEMEHLPRPGGLMALPEVGEHDDPAPVTRTPFNSAPERAPVADQAPDGAGPIERKVYADLAMVAERSPVADSLREMALMLARSADAIPPGKVRDLIAATKELRAILDDIAKTANPAGGGESDDVEGPFGAVRPELVN